jgi:phosphatidate cytidylyltransferase
MVNFFKFYITFLSNFVSFVFELFKKSQQEMQKNQELKLRVKTGAVFGFIFLVMLLSGGFLTNTMFVLMAVMVYNEFHNMAMVNKEKNPDLYKKHTILAVLYSVIPFGCLCTINDHRFGYILLFWYFCVIWATDIGAYFSGRYFGGRKLAPSISPGKTVSGALGGLSAAFIIGFLLSFLRLNTQLSEMGIASFGFLAVLISILAQASDILESAIKRYFGVKDSGNILPGHGGFMDRMDSVTLSAPLLLLITRYFIN